ncbi:hypothetical protein VTH06DRAFT_7606 [Thermothelomyces fergusii]
MAEMLLLLYTRSQDETAAFLTWVVSQVCLEVNGDGTVELAHELYRDPHIDGPQILWHSRPPDQTAGP